MSKKKERKVMMDKSFKFSHVLEAFLGGALVGALVTLFVTPKSGDEVRLLLKEYASQGKSVANAVPKALNAAKDAVRTTIDEGMSSRTLKSPDRTI